MQNNILYIHGFNSSPESNKAIITKNYFAQHFPEVDFYCPQIVSNPNAAIRQLETIVEKNLDKNSENQWHFIGSSLGGYFSTYLSEKYCSPTVLINPAIKPFELLTDYIGEQINPYTNEVYHVDESYINDLKILERRKLAENNYMVMVQTDDEVLDYQQAVTKYQKCQLIVQQGGDHSFVGYENMLPEIVNFFKMS